MATITVLVAMDGDGHFHAENLEDRKACINLIESVEDGDYWDNEIEDYLMEMDLDGDTLLTCPKAKWKDFISNVECRGRIETDTIKV